MARNNHSPVKDRLVKVFYFESNSLNAFKTLSARIRASKTELAEMGEETEDMFESTAKLQEYLIQMTGVDILKEDGKSFKDLTTIVIELGKAFENIDNEFVKQEVAEKLAGKTQLNVLLSAIGNYKQIEKAREMAYNSLGSAAKEQENYAKGIEYSIERTKASFQELQKTVVNSSLVKGVIDFGNVLLNILNAIAKNPIVSTIILGNGLGAIFTKFGNPITSIISKINEAKTGLDALNKSSQSLYNLLGTSPLWGFRNGNNGLVSYFSGLDLTEGGIDTFVNAYEEYLNSTTSLLDVNAKSSFDKLNPIMQEYIRKAQIAGKTTEQFKQELSSLVGVSSKANTAMTFFKNTLASIGISFVITQIIKIIQAEKDFVNYSQQFTDEFKQQQKTLSDYTNQIQEVYDKLNSGNLTYEETIDANKELYSIQNKLKESFGYFPGNINLVTDSFDSQTEALKKVNEEYERYLRNEYRREIENEVKGWDVIARAITNSTGILSRIKYSKELGIGDAMAQVYQKMELGDIELYVKPSGVKELDDLIKNLEGIIPEEFGGALYLKDAQSALDTYKEIQRIVQNLYPELENTDWYKSIETSLQKAQEIVDNYGYQYEYDVSETIKIDYSSQLASIQEAYDAYIAAISSGDEEVKNQAYNNYLDALNQIMSSNIADRYKRWFKKNFALDNAGQDIRNTFKAEEKSLFGNNTVKGSTSNTINQFQRLLESGKYSYQDFLSGSVPEIQKAFEVIQKEFGQISMQELMDIMLEQYPSIMDELGASSAQWFIESFETKAKEELANSNIFSDGNLFKNGAELNEKDLEQILDINSLDDWFRDLDSETQKKIIHWTEDEWNSFIKDYSEQKIEIWKNYQEELTDALNFDELENEILEEEYQKIEDWGVSKYAQAIKDQTIQSVFGNVDMDKRTIIHWSDEMKETFHDELKSWGYNPVNGSIDTVYGTLSNGEIDEINVPVAFTPIMVDENGENPQFLSRENVESYINDLLIAATKDLSKHGEDWANFDLLEAKVLEYDKYGYTTFDEVGRKAGHVLGKGIIAGVGEKAEDISKLMHFSGAYGAIQLASSANKELVKVEEELTKQGKKLSDITQEDIDKFYQIGIVSDDTYGSLSDYAYKINEVAGSAEAAALALEHMIDAASDVPKTPLQDWLNGQVSTGKKNEKGEPEKKTRQELISDFESEVSKIQGLIERIKSAEENVSFADLLSEFPDIGPYVEKTEDYISALALYIKDKEGDLRNSLGDTSEIDYAEDRLQGLSDVIHEAFGGNTNVSALTDSYEELSDILQRVRNNESFSTKEISDITSKYEDLKDVVLATTDGYTLEEEAIRELIKTRGTGIRDSIQQEINASEIELKASMERLKSYGLEYSSKDILKSIKKYESLGASGAKKLLESKSHGKHQGIELTDVDTKALEFISEGQIEEVEELYNKIEELRTLIEKLNGYLPIENFLKETDIEDTDATINDAIQHYEESTSLWLSTLSSSYDKLFEGGKFSYKNVDKDVIKSIKDDFKNVEESLHIDISDDAFESLTRTLSNSKTTTAEAQKAFDDYATTMFYAAAATSDLNEETAEFMKKTFKDNGLDADKAVDYYVTQQKEAKKLAPLYEENQKQLQKVAELEAQMPKLNNESARAIEGEINSINGEINARNVEIATNQAAQVALFNLKMEEQGLSLNHIDSTADIAQIMAIAKACGIAISSLQGLSAAEKFMTSAAYSAMPKEAREAELKRRVNAASEEFYNSFTDIKVPPVTMGLSSGAKDSAGGAGEELADAVIEGYNKELENLKWLKDNGFITEKEYLDQFRLLYQKYYSDLDKYSKEYFEAQTEYLQGVKSYYESAIQSAINILDRQIKKYEDLRDAEKKTYEDQIKANEKLIKEWEKKTKAIDKQIKALQKERKAIEKEYIKPLEKEIKIHEKRISNLQKELEEIEKANAAREDALNLQRSLYELERSRNQRTRLVKIYANCYSNVA